MIENLPDELFLKFFSFLPDIKSLCNAGLVSQKWQNLAFDGQVIRYIFEDKFPELTESYLQGNVTRQELIKELSFQARLQNGFIPRITTLKGHLRPIKTLKVRNGKIFSLDQGGIIKVWNLANGALIKTLEDEESFNVFRVTNEKIITGSSIGTIKTWDLINSSFLIGNHTQGIDLLKIFKDTIFSVSNKQIKIFDFDGKCLHTFDSTHNNRIHTLKIKDKKIVSGSLDGTVKIFDFEGVELKSLEGHTKRLTDLKLVKSIIVSSSFDQTIKIWDFDGKLIQEIKKKDWGVTLFKIKKGNLICGSYGGTLKVFDFEGKPLYSLRGHNGSICALKVINNKIYSGCYDKTIRIWDMNGKLLRTLEEHSFGISAVKIISGKVVSGSIDTTIKIWDFNQP